MLSVVRLSILALIFLALYSFAERDPVRPETVPKPPNYYHTLATVISAEYERNNVYHCVIHSEEMQATRELDLTYIGSLKAGDLIEIRLIYFDHNFIPHRIELVDKK